MANCSKVLLGNDKESLRIGGWLMFGNRVRGGVSSGLQGAQFVATSFKVSLCPDGLSIEAILLCQLMNCDVVTEEETEETSSATCN